MKKYNLFKVVGITFLAAVLLTWILPIATYSGGMTFSARSPLGIYDIIEYPLYTLGFFSNVVVFLLVVGAFYGVLEKTDAYQKLIRLIAKKFKGKENYFLIGSVLLCAIISSVVGLNFGLFLVFPFLISILLLMGYDKLTALSATLGATVIGMFGATFAGTMYASFNETLTVNMTSEIISKIILLVLGVTVLLFFVLKHAKKTFGKNDLAKDKSVKEIGKAKVWPLVLVLSISIFLMILGTIDWKNAFDITFFETAHTNIMNLSIKSWPVFSRILGQIQAFGNWSINDYAFILVIEMTIIALIYKIKFNEIISDICEGAKKMVIPAVICTFAYSLLVVAVYNPVFLNITNFLMNLTGKFNVATAVPAIAIDSIVNVDISYYSQNVLPYIMGTFSDVALYPLICVMMVSIYGLMNLIMPTSIILIASLYYTDTTYSKWIKFIWPVFLILLGLATIMFLIIYLI